MRRFVFVLAALLAAAPAWAADRVEEKDSDGDGKKDTKVYSDSSGRVTRVVTDQNGDGKPDLTASYKNGSPDKGERDSDFDGKVDTWITYEKSGKPSQLRIDRRRKDGKVDYWIHLKGGSVVRREWDRNFDGKPDLKLFQAGTKLIEKQYDDDFDGKFERTVKAPAKGSIDNTPTAPVRAPEGFKK